MSPQAQTQVKAPSAPTPAFTTVPPGLLQRTCACGGSPGLDGECHACRRERLTIQRRALHQASAAAPAATSAHLRASGRPFAATAEARTDAHLGQRVGSAAVHQPSSGSRLEPEVAARFRSGLGSLLDRVRIHHDQHGHEMARQAEAVAVTSGSHIYFAANAYQPHTPSGRELLTHELAHVFQQHRADGPPSGYWSRPGDAYEQEADRIARSGVFPTAPLTLMPPPPRVHQRRTAAEQIATVLRNAVKGWGTDEEAIFNALTGRSPAEIAAIEAAYAALAGGETLESRLRDELSGDDLARALSLLRGETAATEAARQLWNAMRGLGTDEEAIYAAVAGRSEAQWVEIQQAFQDMTGDNLLAELRDELTDSEWEYLNSLLPGAPGGAATGEDRATVIANRIEAAVSGPGTDEEAIYSALTGRTEPELREIERRFKLLTGEELEARLRDELTAGEFERAQALLHPQPTPERLARRLRDAMEGPGTNESAIMAVLTGRSAAELADIRAAYQRLYGEVLSDRLKDELSGADLIEALKLEASGVLEPEDEIKIAVAGLGTDEERLFAVLEELKGDRAKIMTTIDRYAAKGYGDMLDDIRDDLSGADLERAMELLHGETPTTDCSDQERKTALLAVSQAVSMAQTAVAKLDADIAAKALSGSIRRALEANFNPGGAAGAVTLALAGQVRTVLNDTRTDLLTVSDTTCNAPAPCAPKAECEKAFTYGWTTAVAGATVRLCPAFFSCLDEAGRARGMLHEFVHHTGVSNAHEVYKHMSAFSTLTPLGDGSATDSLDHADAYASFAKDVS